ncbi:MULTISPECIES: putative transporter small subunit [unclassified Microbacterium]|nr:MULTISPECIES: putative transporter small subunit [unclassified Microbacterium]
METILLTAYVLVWPIIVVGVLVVVVRAFVKDAKEAKREGRDII